MNQPYISGTNPRCYVGSYSPLCCSGLGFLHEAETPCSWRKGILQLINFSSFLATAPGVGSCPLCVLPFSPISLWLHLWIRGYNISIQVAFSWLFRLVYNLAVNPVWLWEQGSVAFIYSAGILEPKFYFQCVRNVANILQLLLLKNLFFFSISSCIYFFVFVFVCFFFINFKIQITFPQLKCLFLFSFSFFSQSAGWDFNLEPVISW